MRVTRRIGLLTAAGGLLVTASTVGTTTPAGAVETSGTTTVQVDGTLLMAQPDGPGARPSYAVALADGDLVPVRGPLADARPMSHVTALLALPGSVLSGLAARGTSVRSGATLDAASTAGRQALRLVDRRSLTLRIWGTPDLTDPEPAVTPTAHQQFVAAIDNKGDLGQTDTQLRGHVTTVGSYWQGESNGAISSIGVPATVTHYNTAISTTDCGLGNDFWTVVQEAEGKFPGINPFGGSDQLVLFVPSACSSGGIVGEGSVGSSFASGGVLVVKAGSAIEGTYAHETGHNYGFAHANARYSGTSLEYYGVYDVMGFALGGFNQLTALSTPFRVFQGVTDAGEIQDVDLGTKTSAVHATATIKPRSDATGLRSVRVVDPDTGEALYLDYRSGTGDDVGAFYADTTHGYYLNSNSGPLHYAPGVTINAARGGSGNDTLVVDGSGDTSLGAGATWTNASGSLTIHVSALNGTGADVSVDFTPPQTFTTVGTPILSGSATVGGSVGLDVGTWSPAPTTLQVRWYAGGQPWTGHNDATQVVPGPAQVGQQIFARVTAIRAGYQSTTVDSAPVTVQPGTIPVTGNPTISGTVQVGSTLQSHVGTWGSVLSTVSTTWQWRSDGTDIPGATSPTYTVQSGDVGKTISVAEHLTATGYQATTLVSGSTVVVPVPVISPAPTPTVSGTPRVGAPLTAATGTWMTGVTVSYAWSVDGSPVAGATGATYTPKAADLGKAVHVAVTGNRPGYPDVTTTSAETGAVGLGVLSTSKPTILGLTTVGKRLTAVAGLWTRGTTLGYAWYANGKAIKHATGKRLTLTKAQKGKRITVKVTGRQTGYTTASKTSARTAKVR
jgi:hypothetical protein